MDLKKDLRKGCTEQLKSTGFKSADPDDSIYQWVLMNQRSIIPKPRMIKRSKESICPQNYESKLQRFDEQTVKGADLTPYMSKSLKDVSFTDSIFFDWNINHFHLSDEIDQNGFAKRSEYLLLAMVTDDTVYEIQIYKHQENTVVKARDD